MTGYCDVCARWFENPDSGNCECGGKILLTPGTQFSRELIQVPRVELEELLRLIDGIDEIRNRFPLYQAAANFRKKYLEK